MLEASPSGVKERTWQRRSTATRAAFDPTGCFVLAQAQPCRAELFEYDEAIDHVDSGNVLGEAINRSSETFHPCLRDSHACSKAFAQHTGLTAKHSDEWRESSEPHEVA